MKSDGSFKSPTDWDDTFSRIKGLPGNVTAVRIYSISESSGNYSGFYTPLNAIFDASKAHGLDLLLGMYLASGDDVDKGQVRFRV
jgi:hypothetical protein